MGSNMASFMGSEAAIPAKASAYMLSVPGDLLDSPFVQPFQGVPHFHQVLGHAFVFGFVFFLYVSHDKLRITVNPKFRGGKCECEV